MAEKDEPLTERELEVVRLVSTGITNKEIAGKLYLSPSTVKVHLSNVFTKLDVHSRTELTMLAVRSGWVEGATEAFTPDVAPLPLLQTTVQPVVAAVTERTVFVRVPLKVAPNPAPLPALPLWRKIALGVCGLITLLGLTVPGLQARNNAGDAGDPELAPRTGELLPGENTRWAQRAPMRAARARANAVVAGGQVFVIGGDSNGGPSAEVAVFLPRSNTWRNAAAKPTAVRNAASASLDGLIYVSGGQRDANTSANVVEVFDPGSGEWRANAPALPRALSGHVMAALSGRLYVFGGRALDGLNNQGYMFDPSAQSWTAVAGLPTPRSFAAAATSRGKLYVVGGFDNARESALCEVFDPSSVTWSECPSMLQPRGNLGLVQVKDTLYAIGGGRSGYLGFSERFEPQANRWVSFETPLTGNWHSMAFAAIGGEVFAIGGFVNNSLLPSVYVYEAQVSQTFLPAVTSRESGDK